MVLAFAQIAIAQHSAVHSDHGFDVSQFENQIHVDHDDHDDTESRSSHECPECVLVKALQGTLFANDVVVSAVFVNVSWVVKPDIGFAARLNAYAFNPRAPPAFLV